MGQEKGTGTTTLSLQFFAKLARTGELVQRSPFGESCCLCRRSTRVVNGRRDQGAGGQRQWGRGERGERAQRATTKARARRAREGVRVQASHWQRRVCGGVMERTTSESESEETEGKERTKRESGEWRTE